MMSFPWPQCLIDVTVLCLVKLSWIWTITPQWVFDIFGTWNSEDIELLENNWLIGGKYIDLKSWPFELINNVHPLGHRHVKVKMLLVYEIHSKYVENFGI